MIGGGIVPADLLALLRESAPTVVAADAGADRALAAGLTPDWLIGDLDSVSDAARRALPPPRVVALAGQDDTDFEKCLSRIEAPAILCAGFTGGRADHMLAVLAALARYPGRRAVVIDDSDIIFHARALTIDLPVGSRLSLFPLRPVGGRSTGLAWPIDDLVLAPMGTVGTSNRVTGPVQLAFDSDGMLVILPRAALASLLAAWHAEAGARAR